MDKQDHESIQASFYNQVQDALEILEQVRPKLRKLARTSARRSPTKLKNVDIPQLVEDAAGISALLHMALGTYAILESNLPLEEILKR